MSFAAGHVRFVQGFLQVTSDRTHVLVRCPDPLDVGRTLTEAMAPRLALERARAIREFLSVGFVAGVRIRVRDGEREAVHELVPDSAAAFAGELDVEAARVLERVDPSPSSLYVPSRDHTRTNNQ